MARTYRMTPPLVNATQKINPRTNTSDKQASRNRNNRRNKINELEFKMEMKEEN